MGLQETIFFLGVGAQKAGTSWIRSYLGTRPDIYVAPSEMHFFDLKHAGDFARRNRRLLAKKDRSADRPLNPLLRLKLNYLEQADARYSYQEFFRSRVPENVR